MPRIGSLGRRFSLRIVPTSNGLACFATELVDESQTERALKASEERFRSMVESIS